MSSSFDLRAEVISSAALFPIKSPAVFTVFRATLLEAVFAASIPVCVGVSTDFLPYLSPNFLANNKKPYPLTYFLYFDFAKYLILIFTQLPNSPNYLFGTKVTKTINVC